MKAHLTAMRLVGVEQSPRRHAKLCATFQDTSGKVTRVHFGRLGCKDFIVYSRELPPAMAAQKRAAYIARHSSGREDWSRPDTPGSLSRFILWEKPTLQASIAAFKRRFKV